MSAGPIFVWPIVLGDPTPWDPLLAADERERARRYRRASDRAAYVACRGLLRALLGGFLGRDPAGLRFAYGAHEKPALDDGACAFNLSRSNGLALVAISADGPLGVDVEWVRDTLDLGALAAEFLAPDDRAALARLPRRERTREFFRRWVRHEACVKATGRGLVVPAAERPAGLWLTDLELGPGYVAALAAEGVAERTVVLHPVGPGPGR
jgi:4'-phosphopantetheinyl transferase